VIRDFYQVAQADYLGAPTPAEGDKNLPYAFLGIMAVASEDKSIQDHLITTPAVRGCDLENAVNAIELESVDRLEQLQLVQANGKLQAMRRRISSGKIDRETLNMNDRAIFDAYSEQRTYRRNGRNCYHEPRVT
jgi:hypothetical protein